LERIRKKIENYDFSPVKKITISIGFASVDVAKKFEKSIDLADDALYVAKDSGRNMVVEYMNT
jgi:PleD family two-component response regulator